MEASEPAPLVGFVSRGEGIASIVAAKAKRPKRAGVSFILKGEGSDIALRLVDQS